MGGIGMQPSTFAPSMGTGVGMQSISQPTYQRELKEDRSAEAAQKEREREEPYESEYGQNSPSERATIKYYYIEHDGEGYLLRPEQRFGAVLESVPLQDRDSLRDDLKISPYGRDRTFEPTATEAPGNIDKLGHGYYLTPEEVVAITTHDKGENYIESIEVTPDKTIMTVIMHPFNSIFWFHVSRSTFIEDVATKRRYMIEGVSDNVPLGRIVVAVNPEASLKLKLYFPPLEKSVKRVNVVRFVGDNQVPTTNVGLEGGYYDLFLKAYAPK